MIYGTAGFTAAQCVTAIVERGIKPDRGPVVVTGATGGVGSLAVAILAKLGYEVAAVTGKPGEHDWLQRLGAAKILGRSDVLDTTRPAAARRALGGGRRHRRRADRSPRSCARSTIAAASPLAAWSRAPICRSRSIRSSSAA